MTAARTTAAGQEGREAEGDEPERCPDQHHDGLSAAPEAASGRVHDESADDRAQAARAGQQAERRSLGVEQVARERRQQSGVREQRAARHRPEQRDRECGTVAEHPARRVDEAAHRGRAIVVVIGRDGPAWWR